MTARLTGKIDAVVFDLDGTLIDTVPDSHAALNKIMAAHGFRSLSLIEVRGIVGAGAPAMLQRAFALVGVELSPEELAARTSRYMEAYLADPIGHTVIYPDVFEILHELRSSRMKLGVCTNKPKASTHVVLEKLRLMEFFSAILCPEDVVHRKPDGRHLLATLQALSTLSNAAVYVGDSEIDMTAAADAEVTSVFATWGYCHVPSDQIHADASIDRMIDLPAALKHLASSHLPS